MGSGSIMEALGFEKSLATQVVDTFFGVIGPGKYFKALKMVVKFAGQGGNFRKAVTVAEASSKTSSLGRAMMKAANTFTSDVVKTARETVMEGVTEVAREGSVAVLDAAFGNAVAESVQTGLDIASHIESAQSLYSAIGGSQKRRRKMKQGMPRFALDKGGTITRSDPNAATLSMEFGIANGQSYQSFLNKVKTQGILTASHGFDINEFGVVDDSTTTLQECTRTVSPTATLNPTVTLTCGGSNCGSGCTPSSGASSGTISDGAGNYANNANCWWLLATSPGVEIRISFPSFATESDYDYVSIDRCKSASCSPKTQILRQSGSLSASNVYTSTEGFLKVTFTSDGSTSKSGFTGSWNLVSPSKFSEPEDCKVIYVGSPVLLNARIVILRQQVSTEDKKRTLLAAVSKTCGFIAADASSSRVEIGQTVDIPCGGELCSQVDFSITATTNEVKATLQSKMSLQSLKNAHSSLGNVRRQSGSSGIVSITICDGQCGACPFGKYGTVSGSDLSSCADCPGGKYAASQPATSLASCVSCPSNSHSPSGSYNIWSCSCNKGFILSATHTCTICESGKYSTSLSTSCTTCPSTTTSPQGSTTVDDCKCKAGTSGPSGGPCTACMAGSYKSTTGSASCTSCPQNSNSNLGSSVVTDCVCVAGFSGASGGACTACAPGKFKNVIGDTLCAECVAGKFSAAVGATAASTCANCEAGKSSGVSASTVCTECTAGKYKAAAGINVACDNCEPGKYKEMSGVNLACDNCAAGKYKEMSGVNLACDNCAAGKYMATAGNHTACDNCAAGKYKANGGVNLACDNCKPGKYSQVAGASSEVFCLDCPQGKTSAAGSAMANDCSSVCAPGWTGTLGACTQCSIGTYKMTTGTADCVACPAYSHSSETGQSSCQCNAGYTGPDGDCSFCVAGKFKATAGSASCENCDAGKYSRTVGANTNVCLECDEGKFKATSGVNIDCDNCEAGKYSEANASTVCTECTVGKYKAAAGINVACDNCASGKYSAVPTSTTCLACTQGSSSEAGSSSATDCICNAGFSMNNATWTCVHCAAGEYKDAKGSAECSLCQAGKYSSSIAANNASVCLACPADSHSSSGSTFLSNCVCNRGYTGSDGGTCVACEAGTYKFSAGVGDCLVCPSRSSSKPGSHFCHCNAGSVSASAANRCVCDAGLTLDSLSTRSVNQSGNFFNASSAEICIPCPTGTCKPSPGDHSCDISFCPLERPKISPNGGVFTGFVEIMVTSTMPMVVTLNAAEPDCSSSPVKSHILALLSSTTVQVRTCFESRESGVSSASFEVLPGFVVKVSFTMDGITADELKKDMNKFVEALANELGIAKERISNLNIANARRSLSMSFELVASSIADAKLLSTMVFTHSHTHLRH